MFLYIGFIVPTDHLSGIRPYSKIKLNNLLYIGIIKLQFALICWFFMSSIPDNLLFFNVSMASVISVSVIGKLICSFKLCSISVSKRGVCMVWLCVYSILFIFLKEL